MEDHFMMPYIDAIAGNSIIFLTAITVLLLFYYTKETYLLRKESQKQTQSQFTPYLTLRNLEDGATLSNLGKGIAKEVQVSSSVKISSQPILLIPSIGAGEKRGIYHMDEDKEGAWVVSARDLPDEVLVTYSDILGHKYNASFKKVYEGWGIFKEATQGRVG